MACGSSVRRLEMLNQITDLFLARGGHAGQEAIDLFDDILQRLVEGIEVYARAKLSVAMSGVANTPVKLVSKLACDESIEVARPILEDAEYLDDAFLVGCASNLDQAHLLAISRRKILSKNVTEVLVERGNQDVLRSVAGNKGARFSENGFNSLIDRARSDDVLAATIGFRHDLPEPCFARLLRQASKMVCKKLSAAFPDRASLVSSVVEDIKSEIAPERDYSAARIIVDGLKASNSLNEETLLFFIRSNKYEEVVAAIAVMSDLTIPIVEEAMTSTSADPILIVTKAASLSWSVVQAVLVLQARRPLAQQTLDAHRTNYLSLSTAAAQRVARFYKVRHVVGGEPRN